MHHEVLLALSGYPGNIFTVNRQTGLYEVTPDLPFIHPSEISLVNRICRLGTYHLQLKDFISEQNAASLALLGHRPRDKGTSGAGTGGGLYLKALACGLDSVLDGYRQTLVRTEEKCISDPHRPLSHLQSEFEEYQFLLPSLDACVKHVQRNKLQGCQILSHLHEQCSSGIPIVRTAFERILATCHGVLYKQLSSWMLHGMLTDQPGDFFIEPVTVGLATKCTAGKEGEEGRESDQSDASQETVTVGSGGGSFRINHNLAPSYLSLRVVEKILFVGEAVQIFQSQAQGQQWLSLSSVGTASQLRPDQLRFGRMLAELQRQPLFQLREFESTVDAIRDCVAEHLWKLLVEESDLVGHLQTVKDFFLLGRGELFQAFVDLAHILMGLPPSQTTEHDVNVAFQQAMLKVGIDNEDLMRQFRLTVSAPPPTKKLAFVPPTAPKGDGAVAGAWSHLGLSHTVSWPLHILLTPAILEKYNGLFTFLLSLRRAQMALQQSWALLMQYRQRAGELKAVWQLRTHMGFLINNLQYYVQVDVLETQFSQLLEKINSTHDFETIKHAHESFVTTLQSQLFFFLPPVSRCLNEIMRLCNAFSAVLHSPSDLQLSTEERAEVDRIAKDFRRQSSLFFQVVSSVKNHHLAPHLVQLLLRIDYNKFFSTQNSSPLLASSLS